MTSKTIEICKELYSPASAAAFVRTLSGSTMGPCDYLTFDLNAYVTEGNIGAETDTGLLNALDYIQVSLDKSKSGNQGDEGKVLYKLYGAGQDGTDSAVYKGVINTVNRMLWKYDIFQGGDAVIAKAAADDRNLVLRLPLYKNEPVTVSIEYALVVATYWSETGTITYTRVNCSVKAHLVDECEDMKFAMTVVTGLTNAESAPVDIPDRPGYWFLGYAIRAYDTTATHPCDLFGGGTPTESTDNQGWIQIRNDDGQIFDFATGQQIKADLCGLAGPVELYAALRLYSTVAYELGYYGRLMVSPINALNLQMVMFPNAVVGSTDTFRIWFFYVTQKMATREITRTKPQSSKVGSEGSVSNQASA